MTKLRNTVSRWFSADSMHSKILLTLVVLICITILATSLTLYTVFENIMQYQIFVSESDNLTQASYSAEVLFNNAKSTARQIYYDRDISTLRLYKDINPATISNELANLESYKVLTDFISSVYVYNSKSGMIYTTTAPNHLTIDTVSAFFDQDIVACIQNYGKYPCLTPIPREIQQWSTGSENAYSYAYTFIFYENPGKSRALDSAVVLNVNESWMRKTINQLSSGDSRDTCIIDSRGRTIVNSNKYPMLTDLSGQDFIKRIVTGSAESGYFIGDVDGVKSLVIHVPYKPLGWTYVRTIPYGLVMKKVDDIKWATIWITLGILAVALFLAFLQSGKISRPIDRAMSRLKALENEKRNTFYSHRQEFLRDILSGRLEMDSAEGVKCLEEYDIRMRPGGEFLLMLFIIDNYARFCGNNSLKDRNLLKFGVMSIASELLVQRYAADVSEPVDNGVLVILSRNDGEPAFEKDALGRVAEDVQQRSESLGLSLSCFIGPAVSCHAGLPRAFDEICYASNYKMFRGQRCVVFSDSLPQANAEYAYPLKKEKAMLELLIAGSAAGAGKILDEILDEAAAASFTFFNLTVNRLIFSILGAMTETGRESGLHININSLVNDIGRMETVDEIRRSFHGVFTAIEEGCSDRKRQKYDRITEKIVEMIGSKYFDANMSVQLIAECVGFTPAYTSRLFRQSTGKSIVDYINDTRIQKARELLVSTNLNVNDIVERTGFTNAQYFHKVFKKTFGVTPNDMRRQKKA